MGSAKFHTGSLISLAGILVVMALRPVCAADLSLSAPAKSVEGYGVLTNAGKVSIPGPFASDLEVVLTSDDPSEVLVPEMVTILAGDTSAKFDLTIVDDDEVDGPTAGNHYFYGCRLDFRIAHMIVLWTMILRLSIHLLPAVDHTRLH